jgi:hypothetical protein
MGVTSYITYVNDGHVDYTGANVYEITSVPKYDVLSINATSNISTHIERASAREIRLPHLLQTKRG